MKNRTALLAIFLLSLSFTGKGLVWNYTSYDFGKVKSGDRLLARFVCYNKSDSTLIVYKVENTCSCTTPNYTKTPVFKGDSAIITIQFNTEGKRGQQNKYTGVYTNMGLFDLHIKADIVR